MAKKKCGSCRALYGLGLNQSCLLGYKIRLDEVRFEFGKINVAVPDEKCPKPRTWKQFFDADRKGQPYIASVP